AAGVAGRADRGEPDDLTAVLDELGVLSRRAQPALDAAALGLWAEAVQQVLGHEAGVGGPAAGHQDARDGGGVVFGGRPQPPRHPAAAIRAAAPAAASRNASTSASPIGVQIAPAPRGASRMPRFTISRKNA